MPKSKKKQKNKIVAFSIADENNLKYFKLMEKSFHHFHPDIELKLVGGDELKQLLQKDNQFFYRATPAVAWNLFNQGYETVIKIDADSVITGDIKHTWEGEFDVAVVNNSNPREMKKYPVTVWNIHPLSYVNCGYVVMKSPQFVQHWLGLCASPHFQHYQMREQDLLNIMVFYMSKQLGGIYDVRFLDASKYAHGLVARRYELEFKVKDEDLILPANKEWNTEDKIVKIWHAAGGNTNENKMNFNLIFKDEVLKYIKKLTT